MDATTVIAVICSAVVFVGWLAAPTTTTAVKAVTPVSPDRQPVPVSA